MHQSCPLFSGRPPALRPSERTHVCSLSFDLFFSMHQWIKQSHATTNIWTSVTMDFTHYLTWQYLIHASFWPIEMGHNLPESLNEYWKTIENFKLYIYNHDHQGHDTIQSGRWAQMFWRNTLPLSSGQNWTNLGKWQVIRKQEETNQVMNGRSVYMYDYTSLTIELR
jgi:hypothetical protein